MQTAIYMITHGHVAQTKRTIELIHKTGGEPHHLYVVDSGSGDEMQAMLLALKEAGKIHDLQIFADNMGQNICANAALDAIEKHGGYEWVVIWSPDVEPKTRRSLRKLIRAMRMFKLAGEDVIASPKIKGGITPTALSLDGDDVGFPYHEAEVLKGYVRCVAAEFFDDWRFNVFNALAYGEAAEVKERSMEMELGSVVICNIVCKHKGVDAGLIPRHVGYGL